MAEYISYNCTVIGQRYIDKEKTCEDSSISYNSDDMHIAIVADGHGDPKCFRSNVGSRIACEVALESMKEFALAIKEGEKEELLFTPRGAERLTSNLFNAILARWSEKVLEDLNNNPPSDEEYDSAGEKNATVYRSGKGLTHIFGTTLIAMLMTSRYLLVLHQGDGRCVVMHENGKVDQPVPWDPRCEGRNTASLCDEDVLAHWRYHIIDLSKDQIVACYAVSDGIEDSFETMKEMNAYLCMHACDYVNMGHSAYFDAVPAHFAALTKQGSQDDISIGCIIDIIAITKYLELYSLIHEYYVAKGENRRANERLNSMQRKTEYLTDRLEQAKTAFENAQQEQTNASSTLEKMQMAVKTAIAGLVTSTQRKEAAEEALVVAQSEYDQYMSVRNEFVEKATSTEESMKILAEKIKSLSIEKSEIDDEVDDGALVYTQPGSEYDDFGEQADEETIVEDTAESTTEYDEESMNNSFEAEQPTKKEKRGLFGRKKKRKLEEV